MELTSDHKRNLGMLATSRSWRRHWFKQQRHHYGT